MRQGDVKKSLKATAAPPDTRRNLLRTRHPRLASLALAAAVGSLALLLAVGTAQARTTGYHIWNLTGEDLQLTSVDTIALPDGARVFSNDSDAPRPPRRNAILHPGEELHVELENPFGSPTRRANLGFQGADARYEMELDNAFGGKCRVATGNRQCKVEGGRVEMLEPPGTVRRVGSNELQAQAEALQKLCTTANNCEFEPQKTRETYTPQIVYGKTVTNCAQEGGPNVKTTISAATTVTISNSVGVDLKVGVSVLEIFQAGITLKYEHKRSESEEFKQDVTVEVEPGNVGWVDITAPVIRDVGEFTLELGNTAWKIQNVAFDTPDTSGKRSGNFAADHEKLTPEQYKAECPHRRSGAAAGDPPFEGLVPTSAALVKTDDRGTSTADLMRGGPESNAFRGLGGHDVIRGGGGDDTLLGGGGDDLINGGPGEDTIYGGPGSDRIADFSGSTAVSTGANAGPGMDRVDVRDSEGDDSVECDTERTVVFADSGDRLSGPCGRVVRV